MSLRSVARSSSAAAGAGSWPQRPGVPPSAGGIVLGILPGLDRSDANEWVTVSIPTGFGELRNGMVVRAAEVIIAIGGAYGTLSEIALGLQAGLRVFGLHTWEIDGIERVGSPREAVELALRSVA